MAFNTGEANHTEQPEFSLDSTQVLDLRFAKQLFEYCDNRIIVFLRMQHRRPKNLIHNGERYLITVSTQVLITLENQPSGWQVRALQL